MTVVRTTMMMMMMLMLIGYIYLRFFLLCSYMNRLSRRSRRRRELSLTSRWKPRTGRRWVGFAAFQEGAGGEGGAAGGWLLCLHGRDVDAIETDVAEQLMRGPATIDAAHILLLLLRLRPCLLFID